MASVENLLIEKKEKNEFRLIAMPKPVTISALEQALEQIVTEDDTPVDNIFSEKQQRLLVEPLYSSWRTIAGVTRTFWAATNVGLFNTMDEPPIVPDMFLSMNVKVGENWYKKKNRSYFVWRLGKPPEVVVEIISNKKGKEADQKRLRYAQIGVKYYVLYDPYRIIQSQKLKVFELSRGKYSLKENYHLDKLGLSLTLCKGFFEGNYKQWLRWCDVNGELIQTGLEKSKQEQARAEQEQARAEKEQARAEKEWERAEQEQARAEKEWERAEQERERAEKLASQLRLLGIEPESE